jgi:8-oxo-dGTP pyrophosphatase MutT (NUDIX family)
MWLMTPVGFFSVVQKPGDAQARVLTVRARVRADLDALRERVLPELGPVQAHQGTDYAFRAQAPQAAVARAMAALVMDVAYGNFKNEVSRVQGYDRAHAYGEVWHALYGLGEEGNGGGKRANTRCAKGVARAVSCLPEADAYGGLVVDAQHRVLLREPAQHFGGYVWTFAKGCPNPGETPLQAALREVAEETGVQAEVVGHLPFAYPGTTGTSAFAVMRPVGQPGAWDAETATVRWAALDEASALLAQTQVLAGRKRDLQALADLARWLQDHPHVFSAGEEGGQP